MVRVLVTNGEEETFLDKTCDVSISFLIQGNNVGATAHGEFTEELIRELKKHMPSALRKFLRQIEDNYKKEEIKRQAMEKVKKDLEDNKE